MKTIKNLVFVAMFFSITLGITFRLFDLTGGISFLALGFFGFFVYYTLKTIIGMKSYIPKTMLIMQIMIILMSFSLFTRYLYHIFGDYPSLIIVPLFILYSLVYLFKEKQKSTKLTTVTLLYLLLTIPLFGFSFLNSPRQYIPKSWYDRYGDIKGVPVTLPYAFDYLETEELFSEAYELKRNKQYFEAIIIYEQAKNLEPKNPMILFDLSESYARINNLETAIALLDTAIMIDNTYAGFYNNRGLLFIKLKEYEKAIIDYQKAIEIDSNHPSFYANLAMAYYYKDLFDLACQQIEKAESIEIGRAHV